jgi:hypothetical protein
MAKTQQPKAKFSCPASFPAVLAAFPAARPPLTRAYLAVGKPAHPTRW